VHAKTVQNKAPTPRPAPLSFRHPEFGSVPEVRLGSPDLLDPELFSHKAPPTPGATPVPWNRTRC